MATSSATSLAQAARQLPLAEQQKLLALLHKSLAAEPLPADTATVGADTNKTPVPVNDAATARAARLAWLKQHRDDYAGQYVAFAGAQMVAHGTHYKEAEALSRAHGTADPIILFVFSASELPFGGW